MEAELRNMCAPTKAEPNVWVGLIGRVRHRSAVRARDSRRTSKDGAHVPDYMSPDGEDPILYY